LFFANINRENALLCMTPTELRGIFILNWLPELKTRDHESPKPTLSIAISFSIILFHSAISGR